MEEETHAGEIFEDIKGGAQNQDYSQAIMKGALLYGDFTQCIFRHTDMKGADLSGTTFRGCAFMFADLSEANMDRATFIECEFIGCDFRNVEACDAKFEQSAVHACKGIESCFEDSTWTESQISGNFMFSKWQGAKLEDCIHDNILLLGSQGFPA